MQLSTSSSGEVTVGKIEGSLDTQTSSEAHGELDRLMDEGSRKLLLDFSSLDYISSAGLRVLLAVAKRLAPDEGEMRICNPNDVVNEVFEIVKADVITKKVKQGIDEHRAVSGGEDKAVAVSPLTVGWIVLEEVSPKNCGDVGTAQW